MSRFIACLVSAAFCASLTIAPVTIGPAAAEDTKQEPEWRHALSLMGAPKYPAGFSHFDYVNPSAPKGGLVRLASQGTFDSHLRHPDGSLSRRDLDRVWLDC